MSPDSVYRIIVAHFICILWKKTHCRMLQESAYRDIVGYQCQGRGIWRSYSRLGRKKSLIFLWILLYDRIKMSGERDRSGNIRLQVTNPVGSWNQKMFSKRKEISWSLKCALCLLESVENLKEYSKQRKGSTQMCIGKDVHDYLGIYQWTRLG